MTAIAPRIACLASLLQCKYWVVPGFKVEGLGAVCDVTL